MMTSSGVLTGSTTGPLYFFDQPTNRNSIKGPRSNILQFIIANEVEQVEDATQSRRDNDRSEGKPATSRAAGAALSRKDVDPMDAYKRAAPPLLNELARLLSQHKWAERACIPRGIVNILNYCWQDLTAGAEHLIRPEQTVREKPRGSLKLDEARSSQEIDKDKREAGERTPRAVVQSAGPSERKPQVLSNPRIKKEKHKPSRANSSTTMSFSISSNCCSDPGRIIQPKQPSCDEPQEISLCQWVVERLRSARKPEKLQTAEEDPDKSVVLCHYGDAKAKMRDERGKRKAQPSTLINGMPQIPELKHLGPARQKLHYRIDDGSSFIYYPSGCVAVCQSHSGLPCGGFYTNVFSDSDCPVILATITAFGHGTVTHPLSSAITAAWDQDGGFICDHHGNVMKEWSWLIGCTPREKIVIQLSDLISVRLLGGTSATLSFKCDNENVQLPLSALSNSNKSNAMTEQKFTSDAAQDLLLARKTTESPAVFVESKRNLAQTPMVREVEGLEEPSAHRRRGGHVGRELKRLQKRVQTTLDDWLAYYRVAIGIECPDMERMPDAPLRTRLRREVQSAPLPSLNPPEWAHSKGVQPGEGRNELQELHRHLPATAERPLDPNVKLPRTSKKRTKGEPCVTQIGPLQIYGNFTPESVIIPNSLDLQPSCVTRCPVRPSLPPSSPLTVCPPLLRAALLGEGGLRRCCCSASLMPVVTDMEYDAFVMGQPAHSQQIVVVCVTPPCEPVNTHALADQDVLEQLYRRKNKHRAMPCTQCQMDSFRLVRYEVSTGKPSCGEENILLQQRHNAAPGMILMYMRGKLLFVGYIFSGHSCSVMDLQKQICRTRGDYRLGLSLPSDYKFSDAVNTPAASGAGSSQDTALKGGADITLTASEEKEKANESYMRKNNQAPEVSLQHQHQREFCIELKKTSTLPHVPIITH